MVSRMGGLFTEAEVKLLHDSLSSGDGITREEFVKMFDEDYISGKLRQNIKNPLRQRLSSGILQR